MTEYKQILEDGSEQIKAGLELNVPGVTFTVSLSLDNYAKAVIYSVTPSEILTPSQQTLVDYIMAQSGFRP